MIKKYAWTLIQVLLLFLICRCSPMNSHGREFTFPPGSNLFKYNWEYSMQVQELTQYNFIEKKLKREITVVIRDNKDKNLLKYRLPFQSKSPLSICVFGALWDEFERIIVHISERGNPSIAELNEWGKKRGKKPIEDDEYNQWLVKNGPQKLFDLEFKYDETIKKFVLSNDPFMIDSVR